MTDQDKTTGDGGAAGASHDAVAIVDYGQPVHAQLIARRVREHGCYAEIVMPAPLDDLERRTGNGRRRPASRA